MQQGNDRSRNTLGYAVSADEDGCERRVCSRRKIDRTSHGSGDEVEVLGRRYEDMQAEMRAKASNAYAVLEELITKSA